VVVWVVAIIKMVGLVALAVAVVLQQVLAALVQAVKVMQAVRVKRPLLSHIEAEAVVVLAL
jgi:hypothetical protein